MKAGIFRAAAVERLSTPDRIDQPLKVTSSHDWAALGALGALLLAAGVAAFVVEVPVNVPGNGIILPVSGILDVPLQTSGRLTEIAVAPGARVRRGDIVARLDQGDLANDLTRLTAEVADLERERARIAAFQSRGQAAQGTLDRERRDDLQQSRRLIAQRLAFLRERQTLLTQLFAKQVVVKQRVVDGQIELGKAQEDAAANELLLKQIDLNATAGRIAGERERLGIDLKLAAAARARDALALRLADATRVVSPYDGVVAEIKHNRGALVDKGSSLLSLVPVGAAQADDLVVVLFVPSTEGKKIRPGMVAEVSPSTTRREEYGFMTGRVTSVAAVPATEEGMMRVLGNRQLVTSLAAGGAPFEIRIALDRDPRTVSGYRWSSSAGPSAPIGLGTLASGAVQVKHLRLAQLAVPFLQRFFEDAP